MEVTNGFDNDVSNDVVLTWPGIIKEKGAADRFAKDKISFGEKRCCIRQVARTIGRGRVQLKQYENNHWRMFCVNGKAFLIKGMTYAPTKVGQKSPQRTLVSWMKRTVIKTGLSTEFMKHGLTEP